MHLYLGLTLIAAVVAGSAVAAQSKDAMAKPMAMAKTYTGCVATGATAGTFTLTHAAEEMPMAKDGMKKDAMKKDGMGMAKDMAAPLTLTIASTSVDLAGHVGHQVALTTTEATSPMGMARPEAMGEQDAMGMAKPGAMTAPSKSVAVSALRLIATTCAM